MHRTWRKLARRFQRCVPELELAKGNPVNFISSQERERAVEVAASEAQHAELVERINQLTILRESNATLRADCESHAKRARALDVKLQAVTAEMDPIKEQLRVARAELEAKEKQIDKLEDESQSWQKRNAQLLSKVCGLYLGEFGLTKNFVSTIESTLSKFKLSETRFRSLSWRRRSFKSHLRRRLNR